MCASLQATMPNVQTVCRAHCCTAAMAVFAPDYSELLDSEMLSDVDIVIVEEPRDPAQAPAQRRTAGGDAPTVEQNAQAQARMRVLHGHGVVLYGFCSFCKGRLVSWNNSGSSSSSSSGSKPEVTIIVPEGQLEAGELLIKAIYAAKPDLSDCSQSQLLQLLLLADRYGISKVLQAVTTAFSDIPTADLQWDTTIAVYNLPPGCADLDACQGVIAAARQKLQQQLGDLELVWADKQGQKQQQLMQLPRGALLQLLQDPATRVSSENTVFYTIERWQQQQFPGLLSCSTNDKVQVLKELLKQVRVQHCTQLYVATVMVPSALASLCFSPAELAVASIYSSTGVEDHLAALKDKSPVVARYPAWSLPQRPASAMTQLTVEWQLPLQQLKALVEQHLQDTAKAVSKFGEHHMWQGQGFFLQVQLETTSGGAGKASKLGLFVATPDLPAGAVRRITYKVTAVAAGHNASQHNKSGGPWAANYGGATGSWGMPDLVAFPGLISWCPAESKLHELHLVHPDGCLHLKGEVTHMV